MKMPRIAVLLCVLTLLAACSKDNYQSSDISSDKAVALNVSVSGITEASPGDATATSRSTATPQTVITPLEKGLSMEATLTPNNIFTRSTTSLAAGVTYRVIAFKQGNVSNTGYISYGDFTVGGATTSSTFAVPTYGTYTFVCYSLNSTAALPAFDKSSPNPIIASGSDLLYRKFDQYISATASSCKLSILFKYLLPSITVVADASLYGQAISAVSGTFSPGYNALLSLSAGTLSASGSPSTINIPWGTITSGQALSSTPFRIFTNGGAISIAVSSVTIGGMTYTNRTASFSGISGTGNYIMRLKFGKFIPWGGLKWAPGNLIGTANGDGTFSYSFASTQQYYSGVWNGGDYWNWDVLDPTTTNTSAATLAPNVIRTDLDPCRQIAPANTWRMPTIDEFFSIKNIGYVFGTKNGVNGCYLGTSSLPAAGMEDSYLFLPAAGYRNEKQQGLNNVGDYGHYWTTSTWLTGIYPGYYGEQQYIYTGEDFFFYLSGPEVRIGTNSSFQGFSIRCVQ